MRRRQISTFSLSFLDIMSCGLGAAVLLFLIIKHNTEQTTEFNPDLSSETNLLAEEIRIGQENLARIRNTISEIDDELAEARGLARRIQEEIDQLRGQIADLGPSASEEISELEQQIAVLEMQKQTLEDQAQGGNRVREFLGEGDRQYLTGLNMGGTHSLILLDSSSSMLDDTIVNIIRRRIRPDEVKITAPKWQQAVAIVDWITANLNPGTEFQIYTFNETASPVLESTAGSWISTNDRGQMELLLQNVHEVVPVGGTNLVSAVQVINQLTPAPDNIFLITDGLPTQGHNKPRGTSVSNQERINFFNDAYELLPRHIPVNTLLLPMEGDPYAAVAYWRVALETQGSFIAPSRDWP